MSKKGFTLVEVLLSLSITLLIVLNCSLLVKVLKISNQSKYIDTSLENAIFSLSNELITAKNIEYGDSLSFLDENDDSHKIILQNDSLLHLDIIFYIMTLILYILKIRMDLSK